ncbi:MAG: VTT domain-containing protein [Gemmatimonadetes bacterium]|nr:VTT domain-containing protein [Gemmatimonadota bacterium]
MPPLTLARGLPKLLKANWTRGLVFILLCIGLVVVASSDALHDGLLRMLTVTETLITAYPVAGTLFVILFAAAAAMLAFVSSAVVVPVAVYKWGAPISILLLWVGWTLGGVCAYALGRTLGRPVVAYFISSDLLARLEARVSRRTPFSVILLFQLAMPSEVPGYLLGLLRYRFVLYLLALSLTEVPYAAATVYLGATFLERRRGMLLVIGAAVIIVSLWAFHALQRRLSAVGPRRIE